MTGRLAGQSVLVVGGGSGIGRAAAVAMHREGAHTFVLEKSAVHSQGLAEELGGDRLTALTGDGTSPRTSLVPWTLPSARPAVWTISPAASGCSTTMPI